MVTNANESPNLLSHEVVFIMGVMKVYYSKEMLHKGFNVPHFILAQDNAEKSAYNPILSKPLKSANIVNATEILTGLQKSSSSRTTIPFERADPVISKAGAAHCMGIHSL